MTTYSSRVFVDTIIITN